MKQRWAISVRSKIHLLKNGRYACNGAIGIIPKKFEVLLKRYKKKDLCKRCVQILGDRY
jgi:hypothetical protein